MSESEAQFQAKVVELAELLGWRVYHVKNVKGNLRNATALGFPDLCMAKDGRVLFIECKSAKGRRTLEQHDWAEAIQPPGTTNDSHVRYCLWNPTTDWDAIQAVLR